MIPVPEDQSDELVTVAGSTTEYTTEDAACLTSIIELNELFPYLPDTNVPLTVNAYFYETGDETGTPVCTVIRRYRPDSNEVSFTFTLKPSTQFKDTIDFHVDGDFRLSPSGYPHEIAISSMTHINTLRRTPGSTIFLENTNFISADGIWKPLKFKAE